MSQVTKKIAALVAPLSLAAGLAFTAPAIATEYLSDSQGEVVRNAYQECWQVSYGLPMCDEKIVFQGVLFDFNKATIRPEFAAQLDAWAPSVDDIDTLDIEGHTDSVGSDAYNQALSERRANAVADYLAGKDHLSRANMKVAGMGESMPVASNDTDEGRQLNRRVEITTHNN